MNKNHLKIFSSLLLLCLCVNAHNLHQNSQSKDVEAIANAVADVVNVFYVNESIDFEILILGNVSNVILDVVNEVERMKGQNLNVISKMQRKINQQDLNINQSLIVFMEPDKINDFNANVNLTNNPQKKMKFLMCCDVNYDDIKTSSLNDMSRTIDPFVYFIKNSSNDDVELSTITWFHSDSCDKPKITILNKFNKNSRKWQHELEKFDKFHNLYGCSLEIQAISGYHKVELKFCDATCDFIKDVVNIVADKANFNAAYTLEDTNMKIGMKLFYRSTSSMTPAFKDDTFQFLISFTEIYDSYEKLLLPFDITTWWLLIFTFVIAFGIIGMINRMPKEVQEIVYGKGVKTPRYNMIATTFGVCMTKLPDRNFSRIILMLFILFCFIFRTAYQGIFFEMMASNIKKPLPETFQDLIDQNYTNIMPHGIDEANPFYDIKVFLEKNNATIATLGKAVRTGHYGGRLLACIFNRKFWRKVSFVASYDFNRAITHICKGSILKLNEKIMTLVVGIGVPRNNFLFDEIDETTTRLIPSGIIQHLHEFSYWKKWKPWKYEELNVEKSMTVDELIYAFVLWLIPCGISLIVFVLEVIIKEIIKYIKEVQTKHKKKSPEYIMIYPIDEGDIGRIDREELKKMFRVKKRAVDDKVGKV